MVATIRS